MINNIVKIYSTDNLIEAKTISSLLESHDIHVFQLNKSDSSYPFFNLIELFIPLEDEQKAVELLESQE